MRSPWKLITGLVSRGNPERSTAIKDENSTTPDPSGDGGSVEAVVPPEGLESSLPLLTQRAEESASDIRADPLESLERLVTQQQSSPDLGLSSADKAKPILATVTRLVKEDRQNLRAELPTATPHPPAAIADSTAAVANTDGSQNAAGPVRLLANNVGLGNKPMPKSLAKKSNLINRAKSPRDSAIGDRSVKRRTSPVTEPDAGEVSQRRSSASESTILNREINELRQQLAQKLRLQNDQLRRMLARYDAD